MAKKEITIKALNPKSSDTKYIGNEPTWHIQPTEENRISKLATAFQWYNYHYGRKDAKEMIAHYLEIHDRSRDAKLIRGIPDSSIQVTIAWVCRMNLVGLQLTKHEQVLLEEEIGKLIKIKQEVKKIVSDVEVAQQKLTIQDHLREKVSECAGELEGMFDDFIIAGAKMSADFKPISVIRGMNIAPQLVNNITKVWQLRLEEYNEITKLSPDCLVEYIKKGYHPELLIHSLLSNETLLKDYGKCTEVAGSLWAFLGSALGQIDHAFHSVSTTTLKKEE